MHKIRKTRRRWIVSAFGFVCLLATGALLLIGARIFYSLQSAEKAGRQFVEIMQRNELNQANSLIANQLLDAAVKGIADANQNLKMVQPLLIRLHWLPAIGPSLAVAPKLLQSSHQLAIIGQEAIVIAEPMLTAGQSLVDILPAIAVSSPATISSWIATTNQLALQLAEIDNDSLLAPLADGVAQVQSTNALLHAGLLMAEQVPLLLGNDTESHILILVQNNYELRPTGGFITAIGLLTVADGKIVDLSMQDSYDFPINESELHRAPLPMQRYMNVNTLVLRDANWSPDLPSSAQLAAALYFEGTNQAVDGIVTVDLRAVELFVKALQPLNIGFDSPPLTGDNLVQRLKEMWSSPPTLQKDNDDSKGAWWKQRKDFIPLIATAILQRLQNGNFSSGAVANALYRSLDERAIQLWHRNPEIAESLAQLNWDGGLRLPENGDFLALIDSNLGYNKVDAVLERALYYQLQWDVEASGRGLATILLTYRHPLQADVESCEARPEYGDTYDDMMARCYFDFVRLYVPAGSELVGIDGIDEDSQFDQTGEGGSQVFGGYFTVRPGDEKKIIIQYRLPATIKRENYRLTVRKQAGIGALPFSAWNGKEKIETLVRNGEFIWMPED